MGIFALSKIFLFSKIIGIIGVIKDGLVSAASDGKISVAEGLKIVTTICVNLGFDFDSGGFTTAISKVESVKESVETTDRGLFSDFKLTWFQVFGLVGKLADKVTEAASDGVITVNEGIDIISSICTDLGIDFDNEGINILNDVNNTDPAVDEAVDPVDEAVDPVDEAVDPVDEAVDPVDEAVDPVDEANTGVSTLDTDTISD